jgi:hypothetical protein
MKFENIYIDANDDVSTIVEKILNSESSNFVIFVPEDSKLAESEINFKLLAREAKSAGKKIFLQNDSGEKIIAMAEEAGISALEQKIVAKPKASKATFFRDIAPPTNTKTPRGRRPSQVKDIGPKEETKTTRTKEKISESPKVKSMDSFSPVSLVSVEVEEIKASELIKKNKKKRYISKRYIAEGNNREFLLEKFLRI